jgi:hypothetical protein
MATTVTGGSKTLSNLGFIYTERRDFIIEPDTIRELYPSEHPFLSLLMAKTPEDVTDPDFKMFEHRSVFLKQEFQVNNGGGYTWAATGAPKDTITAVVVDNIVGLPSPLDSSVVGFVCEVYASDRSTFRGIVYISAAAGTINLTSMGNPRAVNNYCSNLSNDDVFIAITSAHPSGVTAPTANSDEIEVVYNSVEITRTTLEIEGDLKRTYLRGGSTELERIRREKLKEHNMKLSRKLLYQTRIGGTGMAELLADNVTWTDTHGGANAHITDANSKVVRTTMGVIPAIYRYGTATGDQRNIFTVPAATYDYSQFVDDMEVVFQYAPEGGELVAFCGGGALSFWSKVGQQGFANNSKVDVDLSDWKASDFGFNFRRLSTPHGSILLVKDVSLRGPYNKTMLVVDDSDLSLKQMETTTFMADIKKDDNYDGEKDEYFSQMGLALTMIEKHSVWNIV